MASIQLLFFVICVYICICVYMKVNLFRSGSRKCPNTLSFSIMSFKPYLISNNPLTLLIHLIKMGNLPYTALHILNLSVSVVLPCSV